MRRLTAAGMVIGVLIALSAAGGNAHPAAAADAVHRVGAIDLGACTERGMVVDPSLHVLVVEVTPNGTTCLISNAPAMLELFSTATFKRLAAVPITQASASDRLAIDAVHHRVFVLASDSSAAVDNDYVYVYSIPKLLAAAGPISASTTVALPQDALLLGGAGSVSPGNLTGSSGDAALHFSGSAYDATTDQLYVTLYENFGNVNAVTSQNGPGADDVYLADLDLKPATVRWTQVLDTCVFDTSSTSLYHLGGSAGLPDPVLVRHDAGTAEIEVGCAYSRTPGLAPDSQSTGVANAVPGLTSGSMLTYRVPLDGSGAPVTGSISYALGRTHAYGGIADPTDQRIFWAAAPVNDTQSLSTSSSGAAAVVYEAAQGVYDGAITVSSAAQADGGFQLAVANHRLYSVGPDGILVDGAAATPPGQGVWFSGYSCTTAAVATDPDLRRLLILPLSQCNTTTAPAGQIMQIYQDDYQLSPPATPPDPDSYTIQSAANPSLADSQFAGHAEATGTRLRLIGGIHGAVSGGTFSAYDLTMSALGDLAGETGTPAVPDAVPADYATHEIDLAKAGAADLGNYQASADGITADADGATRAQLKQSNGADWPFQPTACSDPGTTQQQLQYAGDSGSSAQCQIGKQASTSSSASPLTVTLYVAGQGQTAQAVSLPITLGANLSSGTVTLDPQQGLVSTATSEVKGVAIALPGAGELRIDAVTLTISCHAHGRAGTAGCTATRTLSGVTYAGSAVAGGSCFQAQGVDSCGALLAGLNRLRPGILIFRMPDADERADYFGGSPGGYQALGQRELYEHLQDRVLNYDDSQEVPGFQMTYVNDSISAPSRLDLQLADVEAEAHFGVTGATPDCGACGAAPIVSTPVLTVPAPVTHSAPPPPPTSLGGALAKIVQRVWEGVQLLLRSPAAAAAAIALLLMLVSPLLMGTRRRRLELLVQEVTS